MLNRIGALYSLAIGGNGLTIRKARLPDAVAVQCRVEAAYRTYVPRIGRPPGPMLEDYSEVVQQHQAFVAETDAS